MNRIVLLAALAVVGAGCGDWSNEDLRFLAALPTGEDLRLAVPAQADPSPGALSACGTAPADVWLWAKPTSERLNGVVDFVAGLIELVRRQPPSSREANARGWGPWDDEQHPGIELRVILLRTYPAELAGEPRHVYAFQARPKGTADWSSIIGGTFDGASADRGSGVIVLPFETIRALGMQDAQTPRGTMAMAYDRVAEPVTIEILHDQRGVPGTDALVDQVGYRYAGWLDGSGWFGYAFLDAGSLYVVGAGFDAAGRGDAQVAFQTALGFTGSYRQCWDEAACLVHVADPGNYSCGAPPCSFGAAAACPAVPASPF